MGELKIGDKTLPFVISRATLIYFSKEAGVPMSEIDERLGDMTMHEAYQLLHAGLKVGAMKSKTENPYTIDDLIILFDDDDDLLERLFNEVAAQTPEQKKGNAKAVKKKV